MKACAKDNVRPEGGTAEPAVLPTHDVTISLEMPIPSPVPIIALGAELKNTVCLLEGSRAEISQAYGPLSEANAYRQFHSYADRLCKDYDGRTCALAHDLHPAFLTTAFAQAQNAAKRIPVQHHHAHIASCMADNSVTDRVIGISCDGTGYGTDGAVWGCEVLLCDYTGFRRWAHLDYFALPGGDAAAVETWRPALSLARQAFGDRLPDGVARVFGHVDPNVMRVVDGMLRRGFNCVDTSSLGRLFDAVACLTGLCMRNEHEGHAAMSLESAAANAPKQEPYPYRLLGDGPPYRIDTVPCVQALCDDLDSNCPVDIISRKFHETVADALARAALEAAEKTETHTAALSGGCFFNRLLTERITAKLVEGGIRKVLQHRRVSCGDAGLSLGQAVIAAETLRSKS